MSNIIKVFNITPVSASRPRVTRRGVFYGKNYTNFRQKFPTLLGHPKQLTGAISASIFLTIPMAKSWSKKKKEAMLHEFHTQKPDSDNFAKSILDAMSGRYFKDDSQVARLMVVKRWGNVGEIAVKLEEL